MNPAAGLRAYRARRARPPVKRGLGDPLGDVLHRQKDVFRQKQLACFTWPGDLRVASHVAEQGRLKEFERRGDREVPRPRAAPRSSPSQERGLRQPPAAASGFSPPRRGNRAISRTAGPEDRSAKSFRRSVSLKRPATRPQRSLRAPPKILSHGQDRASSEALDLARLIIKNDIWEQGQALVNHEFKELIARQGPGRRRTKLRAAVPASGVPALCPAALEPAWIAGRLTLPRHEAESDRESVVTEAAFKLLGAKVSALADEADGDRVISQRSVVCLRSVAARVPGSPPTQPCLAAVLHFLPELRDPARLCLWPQFTRENIPNRSADRDRRSIPLHRGSNASGGAKRRA